MRRRRSRAGVALLMAITTILFLTVLVTEITFAATVRGQLAVHERDEAKAEGIALTGMQIYRLILLASKQMGADPSLQAVSATMGVNLGDSLWQMVPFINTGLLRMVFVSSGSVDEDDIETYESEGLTEEEIEESRESSSTKRAFLDFDGDFSAGIADEDSRIFLGAFAATTYAELLEDSTALQLHALMSGEENEQFFHDIDVDRWELIANLADWVDEDSVRLYRGGTEDSLYDDLDDDYLAKNASFDTLDEIRLVDGWHRDDIWERFGDKVTIYGGGKVNVNTASSEVMFAVLKAFMDPLPADSYVQDVMVKIGEYRELSNFTEASGFVSFLESIGITVKADMVNAISTESTVFRVDSTGVVGDANVTIEAVIDFTTDTSGKIVYWSVQ